MKENLDLIFNSMNSEMVTYSILISIIIGVVLVGLGLFYKKKGKQWWMILMILGALGIIINGIKYINMVFS